MFLLAEVKNTCRFQRSKLSCPLKLSVDTFKDDAALNIKSNCNFENITMFKDLKHSSPFLLTETDDGIHQVTKSN